jgi:hypothetical protein
MRDQQYGWNFKANTGVTGLTHSLVLNDDTYLKTVVAFSGTQNGNRTDEYQDDYSQRRLFDGNYRPDQNHRFPPR